MTKFAGDSAQARQGPRDKAWRFSNNSDKVQAAGFESEIKKTVNFEE